MPSFRIATALALHHRAGVRCSATLAADALSPDAAPLEPAAAAPVAGESAARVPRVLPTRLPRCRSGDAPLAPPPAPVARSRTMTRAACARRIADGTLFFVKGQVSAKEYTDCTAADAKLVGSAASCD